MAVCGQADRWSTRPAVVDPELTLGFLESRRKKQISTSPRRAPRDQAQDSALRKVL